MSPRNSPRFASSYNMAGTPLRGNNSCFKCGSRGHYGNECATSDSYSPRGSPRYQESKKQLGVGPSDQDTSHIDDRGQLPGKKNESSVNLLSEKTNESVANLLNVAHLEGNREPSDRQVDMFWFVSVMKGRV